MAGGTGFSYARAILEYLIGSGSKRPVFLYWGYARRTGSTSWSRCSSGSATTRR